MNEKTPMERATVAVARSKAMTAWDAAKVSLTAAVEDREGLARVLIRHDSDRMTCFNHDGECCPAEDAHDFESREGHQADAVARWLTGEAS